MNKKILLPIVVASSFAAATPAMAHSGHAGHDLAYGFAHPFVGLDHLLAMLAVGMWAATREAQRAWQAPAVFLTALVAGGLLGLVTGIGTSVEPMVGGSLTALGLLLFAAPFVGDRAGLALIGLFALFHGHAHGTEAIGIIPAYFAGFIAASALLHFAGWKVGAVLFARRAARWATGAVIGATGLVLGMA